MKQDRRKFLRHIAAGTGALATGLPALAKVKTDEKDLFNDLPADNGVQQFNMCGYAAPKLETVRVGIVGLGMRGSGAVERLSYIDGLEITALATTSLTG